MFLRDAPGFAFYFMTYEFIKRKFGVATVYNNSDEEANGYFTENKTVGLFLSGGLSGVATWILCYPADLLKTRL